MLAVVLAGTATAAPRPPCDGRPDPAWPPIEAGPQVQVFEAVTRAGTWQAPACLGWSEPSPSRLVVLTARFRHEGGIEALLTRFAAVSALRGLPYWSVSDQRWQPLILDAAALTDPSSRQRRDDFTLDELTVGTTVHFVQRDNRTSGTPMYRLQIVDRAPDRLQVTITNAEAVRHWGVPLFPAQSLQSSYLIRQLAPGEWGFYSISGSKEPRLARFLAQSASYRNRAVALYRHLAARPLAELPRFGAKGDVQSQDK